MSDFVLGMIFGACFCFMISLIGSAANPNSYRNIIERTISECEKDLPRSQTCVLNAIPATLK